MRLQLVLSFDPGNPVQNVISGALQLTADSLPLCAAVYNLDYAHQVLCVWISQSTLEFIVLPDTEKVLDAIFLDLLLLLHLVHFAS